MMMVDHVSPKERLGFGRRRADLIGVRPWHVTLFLLVAVVAALGLVQAIDDEVSLRERAARTEAKLAAAQARVKHLETESTARRCWPLREMKGAEFCVRSDSDRGGL